MIPYKLTCVGVQTSGTNIAEHPYKSHTRTSLGGENRCTACKKAYRTAVMKHGLFARHTQGLYMFVM